MRYRDRVRAVNIKTQQLRLQALDLRAQGNTYRQISEILGIDYRWAWKLVHEAFDELKTKTRESAASIRELDNIRLERVLKTFQAKAESGNEDAAKVVIKIIERRARMYGVDAPTKLDVRQNRFEQMSDEDLNREATKVGIKVKVIEALPEHIPNNEVIDHELVNDESDREE